MSPPAVSVVIPTYQGRDALLRSLDSLGRQTLSADEFEVVVVVDGSRDGTREALEAVETPFALRRRWQENRGRSAARNAGIRAATGDLVVFVDDDMEAAPGFLAALRLAHESASRLGALAAVHCPVDESTAAFARFWALRFEDFLQRLVVRSTPLHWSETYSGGFSAAREELLAVGGFDESFDGYGLEDFELALRLSDAGVRLELCPQAVAYHRYEKTFERAAAEAESRGRSSVIFAIRHPGVQADFGPRDLEPPSIVRRLVRYVLPRMTLAVPQISAVVTWLVTRAERRRSRHLEFAYTIALEYRYLLGRLRACRDDSLKVKVSPAAPIE